MNRVLLRVLLLGVIGAAPAPGQALAQSAPSPVDRKPLAKQYVDAGLAAQESGDYGAAIMFYRKAYELLPHPALLFNMAQAHRLAGHVDQALVLYRRYLSEDPGGAQAATARGLVTELEARRAEARRAEQARSADARKAEQAREAEQARRAQRARSADAREAEPGRSGEARRAEPARSPDARRVEQAREVEARRGAEPPRAAAPRDDADARASRTAQAAAPAPSIAPAADSPVGDLHDPAPQPGGAQRIAGLVAGAGGVAAVGIGVGFGLHARSLSGDLSRRHAVYDPVKIRAGERANTIAIVGMAGGAALIATGAALYWWGYTQGRASERVSVAPLVAERTAGLVVSGALP